VLSGRPAAARPHLLPHIVEAHNLEASARFCLPLIADTNIREANRPDSSDIGINYIRLMRLSDRRQVTRMPTT
jgi:hypothetical protein